MTKHEQWIIDNQSSLIYNFHYDFLGEEFFDPIWSNFEDYVNKEFKEEFGIDKNFDIHFTVEIEIEDVAEKK